MEKGSTARGASSKGAPFFFFRRLGRRMEASTQFKYPTRKKPSREEAASSQSLGLEAMSHRAAAIRSRVGAGRPPCK